MDLINGEKETVGSVLLNFLQSDEPEKVIKVASLKFNFTLCFFRASRKIDTNKSLECTKPGLDDFRTLIELLL